jgi:hypothetical protein
MALTSAITTVGPSSTAQPGSATGPTVPTSKPSLSTAAATSTGSSGVGASASWREVESVWYGIMVGVLAVMIYGQ